MRTLRRIQTASQRIGPHWLFCVILGAYLSLQAVSPGPILG
jgi:hypothetical protein